MANAAPDYFTYKIASCDATIISIRFRKICIWSPFYANTGLLLRKILDLQVLMSLVDFSTKNFNGKALFMPKKNYRALRHL